MKEKDHYHLNGSYAEMIKLPKEYVTGRFKHEKYNRCLKIVLFGSVIPDSRPRQSHGRFIPVNSLKLKALFKPFYEQSELLQNLMIHSQYHVAMKFYMQTTKKDLLYIRNNQKLFKQFKKDELHDVNIHDVDNSCKSYNDLLFANEYRITTDDAHNVCIVDPEKFTSLTPRVEILVVYTTKPNKYYDHKIKSSAKYFCHMVSRKYMLMQRRTPKQQTRYIKKYLDKYFTDYKIKNIKEKSTVIKRLSEVLNEYPSATLKEMGDLDISLKFDKYDAIVKILMLVLANHDECLKAITNGIDSKVTKKKGKKSKRKGRKK